MGKKTTLTSGRVVSTVRMPVPKHIRDIMGFNYETMVFESENDWTDIDCQRYQSEKDALAGHEEMVQKWSTRH